MPQLSIRLQDEIMPDIEKRGDKSSVVRESLERYFLVLSRARASMRGIFTESELSLMIDASNGVIYQAWSIPYFVAGIEDAINLYGIDEKWKVDGTSLLAKILDLDAASIFALVDSMERYWCAIGQGESLQYTDLLK